MELVQSQSKEDWVLASEILQDVIGWLDSQGTPLWEPQQVSVEGLSNLYTLDELYFFNEKGKRVGLVFLQTSDPHFWPEVEADDSLYVHKLCFISSCKGAGLGNKALYLIKKKAKDMGKAWLRLDCDDRQALHVFYKANDFQFVDLKNMQRYTVARYKVEC